MAKSLASGSKHRHEIGAAAQMESKSTTLSFLRPDFDQSGHGRALPGAK
jgi:hypothetical protein